MSMGLGDDIADTLDRLLELSQAQSAQMRQARTRGIPDTLEFTNLIGTLFSGQCSITSELNRLKSYLGAARTARLLPQRETPPLIDRKMLAAGDHTLEEEADV